ncbi:MAG TPA: NAD-dependent epimerase/dehydratase family protein [Burkholderiales bacterium]|jgi:NADH dehydrogenase
MARLVITGASGYIGAALCRAALEVGDEIVVLGGGPPLTPSPSLRVHPWRLGEALPEGVLQGADALIHLAHAWAADAAGPGENNPNFSGSVALAAQAAAAGCPRMVFVSTTSAHEEALNTYGRVKRDTEAALLARHPGRVLVARVGLVYGGQPKGLFGLLSMLVRVFPVLPLVGGATQLQPIHVREVAHGVRKLATLARPDRERYVLAQPHAVRFDDYLRLLRRTAVGRRLFLLPIPVGAALALCDLTQKLPFLPGVSRERVYGLVAARPMPSADDLAALDMHLMELRDGLLRAPHAGRRRLIAEARALLRYLGMRPPAQVRILARAFERNDGGEPLHLPALLLRFPALLRWADPLPRRPSNALARRLEMALALQAVAAPLPRPGLAQLAWQCAWDGVALPARLLAGVLRR